MIVNTTAGMGGDLYLDPDDPSGFAEGTDLVSGVERLAHVEELLPDICTLDCGSLNFGEGSLVYVSTPDMLRDGAKRIQELGVPRGDGDLRHRAPVVRRPARRGGPDRRAADVPALHGHPVRRARRPGAAGHDGRRSCPTGAVWASFALGRMQMPWVAQSVLLGGHVRVGLEDNLYLGRGVKATNAQLVERARHDHRGDGRRGRHPGRGAARSSR